MSTDDTRLRWQFSLRNFLVAVLIVGSFAGVAGPILLESITEWKPRPLPPKQYTRSVAPPDETGSYYESGETPLD